MATKSTAAAKREEWLLRTIEHDWQPRSVSRLLERALGMGIHCSVPLLRAAAISGREELLQRIGRLDEVIAETRPAPPPYSEVTNKPCAHL